MSVQVDSRTIYSPLYPEVYHWHEEFLLPEARRALLRDGHVGRIAFSEQKGVVVVPLLEPSFCENFVEEMKHLQNWYADQGIALEKPNSMHQSGLALDNLCIEDLFDGLFSRILQPLANQYFASSGGEQLNSYYPFMVHYEKGSNEALDYHVDASNVTMNMCLSDEFSGSELNFAGERCREHINDIPQWYEQYTCYHKVGHAIIHSGMHRHAVNPLRGGQRHNLLLWCRHVDGRFFHDDERAREQCGQCC